MPSLKEKFVRRVLMNEKIFPVISTTTNHIIVNEEPKFLITNEDGTKEEVTEEEFKKHLSEEGLKKYQELQMANTPT